MRPDLGDVQRLKHILDAISDVEDFLSGMNQFDFKESKLHISAVERQLEIIGEAANSISDSLKEKYSGVDWKPIRRFRNVVVHEYFGVSSQILWGVIQKELPVLKVQISEIINEIGP